MRSPVRSIDNRRRFRGQQSLDNGAEIVVNTVTSADHYERFYR